MSPGALFIAVLRRDLIAVLRRAADLWNPVVFFVLVVSLFPLALSPRPETLRLLAPGVLWIGALLAVLMSLNQLFRADVEDGSMEQMLTGPHSLGLVMLAKIAAHWLLTGLPLVIMAPVVGMTYHLDGTATQVLALSLLLGTPTLCLVGAIGAALTAGVRQSGTLLALMVAPLMLPVLILGARATDMALSGESVAGPLYLLGALLALACSLAPAAAGFAVRLSMD